MASVPILNPLDQIASRPAPTGYQSDAGATPAAFGAGTGQTMASAGQGLQKLGDAGISIATDIQQEDNTRALKQADVTLADKTRVLLYGDGTAQNPGYFSKRGDDAVNAAPSTMAALKQAHDDVMGGLTNKHVQEIFSTVGQQRVVSAQQSVGSFIDQQRLVANVGASDARQKSTINDAASAWNDPKQLATSLAIVQNEAAAQGKLLGWSPDEVKAKGQEATASLFANVIKAAGRTGDFATAQKILQDNRDVIPGSALPGIERELRTDQHMAQAAQEHAMLMQDRAEAKASKAALDGYISKAIDPSQPDAIDLHAVANDTRLNAAQKVELYRFAQAQDKGQPLSQVSAATSNDLFAKIHLPDGDPSKITDEATLNDAFINGRLNRNDLGFLRKEIADDRDPQGNRLGQLSAPLIKAAVAQIQGSGGALGLPDPNKAMNGLAYTQMVKDTLSKAQQNNEDPRAYLTPGNPKYLGSPAVIASYQRSYQDIMKDTLSGMTRPTGAAVAPSVPVLGAPAAPQYKSADDVRAAVKSGKLGYDDGVKILRDNGWAK